MVHLSDRATAAVVQLVLYIPIFFLGLVLTFRNGFSKKGGWFYMVLLSVLMFVAGILAIVAANSDPTDSSTQTMSAVSSGLESAGMSPLINASIGFLKTIGQFTLAEQSFVMGRGLTLLEVVCSLALLGYAYSASSLSNAKNEDALDRAYLVRRISAIGIAMVFVAVMGVTAYAFSHRSRVLKYRRRLLMGITAAMPFIAVRVAYSVLGAFADRTTEFDANGQIVQLHPDDPLQKLNPTSGSFVLFIALALVLQYIAVLIICVVGVRTPLKKDEVSVFGNKVARVRACA